MTDIENLSSPDLVAFAMSRGLKTFQIRGLSRPELISLVNRFLFSTIRIKHLSWPDIKKLAKTKGINTYKKKRNEIEILLKELNNGNNKENKENKIA